MGKRSPNCLIFYATFVLVCNFCTDLVICIMNPRSWIFKHFSFILSLLDCFKIFPQLWFVIQLETSSVYSNLLIGFFPVISDLYLENAKKVCQITLLKLGSNPTQFLHLKSFTLDFRFRFITPQSFVSLHWWEVSIFWWIIL